MKMSAPKVRVPRFEIGRIFWYISKKKVNQTDKYKKNKGNLKQEKYMTLPPGLQLLRNLIGCWMRWRHDVRDDATINQSGVSAKNAAKLKTIVNFESLFLSNEATNFNSVFCKC